ncbi:MAG: HeH/LEM domain-containing protein, partial [Promethearchaeota archaeon]
SKWTVKQLKAFCSKHGIKVPSSYRKADIIRLVKENVQNSL